MKYLIIPVTSFSQNCSLVWCEKTGDAALVDPGGEAAKIIGEVAGKDVKVRRIMLTHGHLDHVGAAAELAAHYGVPIVGPHSEDRFLFEALPEQSRMFGLADCQSFTPDQWLAQGDVVRVGEERFEVLHCPGHTPGHIVFYNRNAQLILMGDVLFRGGVGRSDFPRGSHQALMHSIRSQIMPLGDDIAFIPGHGATSTLGYERLTNPFL